MRGSFKPERATPTPAGDLVRRPVVVSFSELDQNPRLYLNRLIQVSGAYASLPSLPCARPHGPTPGWALLGEELRLEGRGFERALGLLPEGAALTLDGFWRRYEGPVGCGKEPPDQVVWYLEAVHLVQPNPVPGMHDLLDEGSPRVTIEPLPTPGLAETATATPSLTPTATPSLTGTPATPTPSATPSATLAPGVSPSPSATPSPSVTPRPGSTTPAASATATMTATPSGSGSTPTPPPATATGVPQTPAPTFTPGSYPNPTDTPSPYG